MTNFGYENHIEDTDILSLMVLGAQALACGYLELHREQDVRRTSGGRLRRLPGDVGLEQPRRDLDCMGGRPISSQMREESGVVVGYGI